MTLAIAFTAPAPPTLRPYQVAAIDAVQARFAAGDRGTLLVLATGLGKTVCFAELARLTVTRGHRALVLAHRTELLEQARNKLAAIGVDAAIEQGPKQAGRADVVVASVQTLRGARLQRWAPDAFDLIVIDEAHHAVRGNTYGAIVDHFTTARVLGVTATPDRADGVGLGPIFQSIAYRYDLGDDARARRAGRPAYLAPIVARRIKLDVDLDKVKTVAGDLDTKGLAELMTQPEVIEASSRAIMEMVGDRTFLVFTVDVAHAHLVAAACNLIRPGSVAAVSGETPTDERARVLAALADGSQQGVANAMLLTEGFDCPRVACVATLRLTKSRALFTQQVGRGTRQFEGKQDLLVLDFAGLTRRHKLVSTVDCLLGDGVTPEQKTEIERRMEDGAIDPEDVLAEARAAIAAARFAPTWKWITEDVGDLLGVTFDAALLGAGFDLATDQQRAELAARGIKHVPPGLTDLAACDILAKLDQRKRQGYASPAMVRYLISLHVPAAAARDMSTGEAGYMIGKLKELPRWDLNRAAAHHLRQLMASRPAGRQR